MKLNQTNWSESLRIKSMFKKTAILMELCKFTLHKMYA